MSDTERATKKALDLMDEGFDGEKACQIAADEFRIPDQDVMDAVLAEVSDS